MRHPRGSTLLVALVVIVVLTMIGMASVTRGTVEVEAAGMRRRYASELSCLDAARELVVSQLVISGARVEHLSLQRQVGDLSLSTGHYDTGHENQVRPDTSLGNCGTGGGGVGVGDISNRNWIPTLNTSCGVLVPVTCRDESGRALELEFLVRVGL